LRLTEGLAALQVGVDTVEIVAVLDGISVPHDVEVAQHVVFPGLLLR